MLGAAIVVSSGLLLAFNYLTSWRDVIATAYGRTLALKLAVFLAILACGALNWRQVRTDAQPRTARLEVTLAALLVVVTAFLTEMAHP